MYIADLHIHSLYSRATSKDCDLAHLDLWARRKGIGLVGTGDFTHPAWRAQMQAQLLPAEEGLYTLRQEARLPDDTPGAPQPRFVVTGEISSIYKKDGKVRKVHSLLLLPDLQAAQALAQKLEAIGNLHSDGRPILGLDCHDLLEIMLDTCPQAMYIPAHIWTPHFSLFGAFSGFDRIEDCFGDLTPHIHALETGLSSDPPMNWRVSALDRFLLVSHSDAHSPAKLGREADLIDAPLSYPGLAAALSGKLPGGLAGTIEFFPEEGKYHYDGHRKCGQCLSPQAALALDNRCPTCGKRLTIGVEHRVEELADRAADACGAGRFLPPLARPFTRLVPLPEVIGASLGVSAASKKVEMRYRQLLRQLGPEFAILRELPLKMIGSVAGACVEEGVRRLRAGRVRCAPGYDGAYGKVELLSPAEIEELNGQTSLFAAQGEPFPKPKRRPAPKRKQAAPAPQPAPTSPRRGLLEGLNAQQERAVTAQARRLAVIAGPGTGKTHTLVARIAYLLTQGGVPPEQITAVTFTNKAAQELRDRLTAEVGRSAQLLQVGTFHALCLDLLRGRGETRLLDEGSALAIAAGVLHDLACKGSARRFLEELSRRKCGMAPQPGFPQAAFAQYAAALQAAGALDFDDLLLQTLAHWQAGAFAAQASRFSHLLVDEFQDCNPVQNALVHAWSAAGSLFVIGDPDQAIYGFRGATAQGFAQLRAAYPDLRTVTLTENYRSTPQILQTALAAIQPQAASARVLTPTLPDGPLPRLCHNDSALSEGICVAKEINRLVGGMDMLDAQALRQRARGSRSFADMAVLVRTRRQMRTLAHCFAVEGIPCVVAGREDFLAEPSVRGTAAFFRALLDPTDSFALENCLRAALACPAADIQAYMQAWRQAQGQAAARLDACEAVAVAPALQRWQLLARRFLPRLGQPPATLVSDWAQAAGLTGDAMQKLLDTAALYADLPAFLQALLLGAEGDLRRRAGRGAYDAGAVTLMTLHAAKGLEFPVVFLCGVQKGVLPLEAPGRPANVEEERRLFYVGLTRAKESLYLLGSGEASPFLAGMPPRLFDRAQGKPRGDIGVQLSLF